MRKLKAITIKGLFGRHNYELNFDEKGGFTMLAAPNGYGKSTILKIIRAIASGNVFYFENLDFKEIKADYEERHFDNLFGSTTGTSCLKIEKVPVRKKKAPSTDSTVDYPSNHFSAEDYNPSAYIEHSLIKHEEKWKSDEDDYSEFIRSLTKRIDDYNLQLDEIKDYYPKNRQQELACYSYFNHKINDWKINYKKYLDYENSYTEATINFYFDPNKVYSLNKETLESIRKEIKQKFDGNNESLSELFYKNDPSIAICFKNLSWLLELKQKMQVPYIYIGANRDITGTDIPADSYTSVNQLSRLILRNGNVYKDQYNQVSQKLDNSLLNTIINTVKDTSSMETLKEQVTRRYKALNNLKARNAKYGIESTNDDKNNDIDENAIHSNNNEASLAIINKVLGNNLKKLDIFSPYVDQLEFFKNTLDKMLSFVKVKPSFNGLEIYGQNPATGEEIMLPLEALSSGEHQLITILGIILFYEDPSKSRMASMLFSKDKNASRDLSYRLILVDEPEISMHPAWQEDLADFLWNIKEKYSKEFIIATHSPTFIGRRWNNVFELAELADGNKSEE